MFGKIIYQKRWWVFWWFIAFVVTALSTTVFFPEFKGTNIAQVFNSMPKSLQHVAGTGSDFTSIGGYIRNEVFGLRAPLLTIIFSIIVFNNLTVGEERRGILETHVGLPLSRSKILFSKLFAAIFIILVSVSGLIFGTLIALAIIHDHYPIANLVNITATCAALGITFGLVTFTLNAIFGIRGIVLGLSCAYAFFGYILTTLVVSVHGLSQIEKASLFHYYSTTGSYNYNDLAIFGRISLVLIILSVIFFSRRDIET